MRIKCFFNGTKFSNDVRVVLGKKYPLFKSHYDDEIVIVDNTSKDINLWLCHKGYFVKEIITYEGIGIKGLS